MGSFVFKCKKCGVRHDYYPNNLVRGRNSCRRHNINNKGICVDCHGTRGHCYHKFGFVLTPWMCWNSCYQTDEYSKLIR